MISLLLISICVLLFYYLLIKPQLYWKFKNIKQGAPVPLLGDQWRFVFRLESFRDFYVRLYNRFPKSRYCGVYQSMLPGLLIRDPELIKRITIKDFDHFTDHRNFTPELMDPVWHRHLFALKGDEWRVMRNTISPTFTTSKMKGMFPLMYDNAQHLVKYLMDKNEHIYHIDAKELFTRYGNDTIANCAFGIDCNSFENPNNEFYMNGVEITNLKGFRKNLAFFLNFVAPKLTAFFNFNFVPNYCGEYFKNIIQQTVSYRKSHNIIRPDMIHLLMETQMKKPKNGEEILQLSDMDMAAHVIIFFFAGFDTTTTPMAFLALQLALSPDVQKTLKQEIDVVLEVTNGKLTPEALMGMKYLDMVISECLRMYPSIVATDRVCTQPYTIEPVLPDEVPVTISVGEMVWIPSVALHYDPKYFPDPKRFDPERFSDENKQNILPGTYLPFGAGPRICIGSRFGLMAMKISFFCLLANFEIVCIDKTPMVPIISKGEVMPHVDGGFWIGLKKHEST